MSDGNIWTMIQTFFNTWQNLFVALGVLVAIGVAGWTVFYDKKNLKLNGLNIVFQKLNDVKHREIRRNVLSAYYNWLVENNKPIEYTSDNFLETHPKIDLLDFHPNLRDDVESLKSDFEQIAVLEKNGLLDQNAYFDAFYGSMLRCYGALHGNINKSRNQSGTEHYTTYFERQCNDAIDYWKKPQHKNFKIKYHSGEERTDFTLQRFKEGDIWKIRILHPQSSNIQNCQVFSDQKPLTSSKHNDSLEHTIELGSGDNFFFGQYISYNPIITIKADRVPIIRRRFLDIEETQP